MGIADTQDQLDELKNQLLHWKTEALEREVQVIDLEQELSSVMTTVSNAVDYLAAGNTSVPLSWLKQLVDKHTHALPAKEAAG